MLHAWNEMQCYLHSLKMNTDILTHGCRKWSFTKAEENPLQSFPIMFPVSWHNFEAMSQWSSTGKADSLQVMPSVRGHENCMLPLHHSMPPLSLYIFIHQCEQSDVNRASISTPWSRKNCSISIFLPNWWFQTTLNCACQSADVQRTWSLVMEKKERNAKFCNI